MSAPTAAPWAVACPVCATPAPSTPSLDRPLPCARCGLPAVGQAGLVVARITATLAELAQDRDALLATLRTLTAPAAVPPPPVAAPPPPVAPRPVPPPAPAPAPARVAPRLSPQQVLLGLGAALVVAAALAFVAVGWQRFGLAFQAGTMLVATAGAIGASAVAARRGLRATEEALAGAAAALVAVDLGALHARGLLGVDAVPLRTWTAVSALLIALVALTAGRATRSTIAWPLAALLVLQPVPLLLLPAGAVAGPAGVGLLLLVALADLGVARRTGRVVSVTARVLALLAGSWGVAGGLTLAWAGSTADSWTATALLTAAAVAVLVTGAVPGPRPLVAGLAAAGPALALGGSLAGWAGVGAPLSGLLGWAGVLAGVLSWHRTTTRAACASAGAALAASASLVLLAQERTAALALVTLAAAVPATAAAFRVPALRTGGTALSLAAPVLAVLLAEEGGLLSPAVAGMLLTSLAVVALAVAGARTARPEELAALAAGAAATLAAATITGAVGAWSQLGVQLGVVGAAGLGYAVVSRRAPAAAVAVADLVVAVWTVLGGAQVELVEAYTLPLAAALTLLAVPALRRGPSWTDWGPALLVALVPSVLMVLGGGSVVRLVLVVIAATTAVVVGATTHRQAPFVVGAASLGVVVLAELAPLAPLLPRWLSLGAAGLVLLVVGATYERRRQQAREAVAWIGQMG